MGRERRNGGKFVYTARHVIFDRDEWNKCDVILFDDGESEPVKLTVGRGGNVGGAYTDDDTCSLRVYTCDSGLVDKLGKVLRERNEMRDSILELQRSECSDDFSHECSGDEIKNTGNCSGFSDDKSHKCSGGDEENRVKCSESVDSRDDKCSGESPECSGDEFENTGNWSSNTCISLILLNYSQLVLLVNYFCSYKKKLFSVKKAILCFHK